MRTTYLDYSSESDDDGTQHQFYNFKVTFIGATGVGKTSLIKRLKSNRFSLQVPPTLAMEVHKDVRLGDIFGTLWEMPQDACTRYYLRNFQTDAIVVVVDSDRKKTLQQGVALWSLLNEKLHKECVPDIWFVYRGMTVLENIPYCCPDRLFKVDMMSNDGLLDFLFDLRSTLRIKYK